MNRSIKTEVTGVGDKLARKAEDLSDTATTKARKAVHSVGEQLGTAADSIREKIDRTVEETSDVMSNVKEGVRSSAAYLQDQGFSDIMDDVGTLIKRYPIYAMLIGAGIGFMLVRRRTRGDGR